jgi:hypothetical protein
MNTFDTNEHAMYLALQDCYPLVIPSEKFIEAAITDFSKSYYSKVFHTGKYTWHSSLKEWFLKNAGLLLDPAAENWDKFRIVDKKLYMFALVKYS